MLRNKKLIIMYLTAIMLYLSSCSYVVNGRYHYVTIRDTSHVANGAEVTNRKGQICYNGTIPVQLSLKKGSGFMRREEYNVLFYCDQMSVFSIDTICFSRSKSYWANLYFFNYPGFLIVDPWTGAMWLSKDTICEPNLSHAPASLPGPIRR
jgi:hypothetical protein